MRLLIQYISLITRYLIKQLLHCKKLLDEDFSKCFDLLSTDIEDLSYFKHLGWSKNQFKYQFLKKINFSIGLFSLNLMESFVIGDLINVDNKLEYEILLIYVYNSKRNKGYATKLLNNIPFFFENNKLKKIYLEVASNNKQAIKLYEKNDFKKEGIRKNYYQIDEEKINAYFYNKIINE